MPTGKPFQITEKDIQRSKQMTISDMGKWAVVVDKVYYIFNTEDEVYKFYEEVG